jgi:hypothetical protein
MKSLAHWGGHFHAGLGVFGISKVFGGTKVFKEKLHIPVVKSLEI